MSRILDAIGRLLPARAPKQEAKASATGPLIAWEPLGQPVWSPRDYAAFAREGFMQNAIVYRGVRMIAEAAASVPLLLYEGAEEIDQHPLIDLIAQPSPDHTSADFLEAWYGYLLVSGNAYVEAVAVSGRLRELYVLRPDRMKVIPGPNGWPEAFEYSANGTSVRFAEEPVAGVRPILHTRLFHPDNDHYGMSPIEAAAAAVDIHNEASAWNKALLDNSARPSGALVYAAKNGNLTGEQFKRLRGELEEAFQGARNAGRPMLLEGGLDWKPLSLSPKDMDFIAAKYAAARDIALALGVPPMLLGIPGDNTYSNYQEAQRAFWRGTVLPLVFRMAKAFSAWLAPAYGGGVELRPDLDQVEGLSGEREALWARIERASFLTLDEKRAAVGYGPAPREEVAPQSDSGDAAPSFGGEAIPFVKYSPDQPRVPSGNSDGGQWTDGGGGGGSSAGGSGSNGSRRTERVRVAQANTGTMNDAGEEERLIQLAREAESNQAARDEEPRVTPRYTEDGSLAGTTVVFSDGVTISSDLPSPEGGDAWDERHTVTTGDDPPFRFERAGDAFSITSGQGGDTLVVTSEWTASGPETRLQPAFSGRGKALEAAVALFTWLSSQSTAEEPAVLGLRANEYSPGEPDVTWVGRRTREEVDEACPEHGTVQRMTDEAADTVTREGNYLSAVDYGTKVHAKLRRQILAGPNESLWPEVSLLKTLEETGQRPQREAYGAAGTIRIDVFEDVKNGTVCVYDIKTGKRGLSLPRSKEIASAVYKRYPDTQRIIVIETRPK